MKIVTSQEIKEIDKKAIEEYGIPGLILMENAGLKIFQNIKNIYPDLKAKKIVIFAGSGNNGGDGLVVARHLYNYGVAIKVLILSLAQIKGEAKINWEIINKLGVDWKEIEAVEIEEIEKEIRTADLIIDAILGTGLKGAVSGLRGKVIDLINSFDKEVIAVDVPSGLDSDTGRIAGPCIRATYTVTLGLPKVGLMFYPGASYAGKVIVEDIGFPKNLLESERLHLNLVNKETVKALLPERLIYGHKGSFGKVLLLAGSRGMTGAASLASQAALRSGAGLVFLGIPQSLNPIMEVKLTEVITLPLPETKAQTLSEEAEEEIFRSINNFSVVGIGPGISRQLETQKLVRKIIEKSPLPLVVDADALYALKEDPALFKKTNSPVVITPHPGELATLINQDIKYVLDNQLEISQEVASNLGLVVVLKGARTIIADNKGETYINIGDNSGMATGGSGDVLTGIICGLIAQGADVFSAAIIGAYVHSLAGNLAREVKGERGMIAGDILSQVPQAFLSLEGE